MMLYEFLKLFFQASPIRSNRYCARYPYVFITLYMRPINRKQLFVISCLTLSVLFSSFNIEAGIIYIIGAVFLFIAAMFVCISRKAFWVLNELRFNSFKSYSHPWIEENSFNN